MSGASFSAIVISVLGESAGCGGRFSAGDDWKEFRSPTDPKTKMYHNNLRCAWTINAPRAKVVQLRITKLDLPPPDNVTRKCYDFLQVYDGHDEKSHLLFTNSCLPVNFNIIFLETSYKVAYVYFSSDTSVAREGFTMEYRAVAARCGGSLQATDKQQSLQYTFAVTESRRLQRCRWYLHARNLPMEINFRSFSFPIQEHDCKDTYFEIRDLPLSKSDCQHPAFAKDELQHKSFCGEVAPTKYTSRSCAIQITVSAKYGANHPVSFNFDYSTIGSCNRTILIGDATTGRVTSPNYPNDYPAAVLCITQFIAPVGNRILLVFKYFSIPHWMHCERDYLEDYLKVIDPSNRQMDKVYCTDSEPTNYLSLNNTLTIEFKSTRIDHSHGGFEGFDAYYYAVSYTETEKVNFFDLGHASHPEGVITNIGYPYSFGRNQHLRFQFIPPEGHLCVMRLMTSYYRTSQPCSASAEDYLTMTDVAEDGSIDDSSTRRIPCPSTVRPKYEITNSVILDFYTDDNSDNDGPGFRMDWECKSRRMTDVEENDVPGMVGPTGS